MLFGCNYIGDYMGMIDRLLDQEELREIVSRVWDGTFPYEEKDTKEIDFLKKGVRGSSNLGTTAL